MPTSYGSIIRRALAAGAVVGVLVAAYLYTVVEPTISVAIDLEEAGASAEAADGPAPVSDDPPFTRGEQVGGGMAAAFLTAMVVAVAFGTVYASLRHRVPARSDLPRALWLAAVGFGTIALIPALKYPASPPGVGDPETVGERTILYLGCLAASTATAVVLSRISGALRARLGDHTRIAVVAALGVVAYGVLLAALPAGPQGGEPAVPPELLWDFRVRSLGGLALLWLGLGLGLGWLLDRDASPTSGTPSVAART